MERDNCIQMSKGDITYFYCIVSRRSVERKSSGPLRMTEGKRVGSRVGLCDELRVKNLTLPRMIEICVWKNKIKI